MDRHKRAASGGVVVAASGGVLALIALVGMMPAFACTAQPYLRVTPSRADPGQPVRVEGTRFEASSAPVDLWWGGNQIVPITSVIPSNGTFAVNVQVPASASPGRPYQISAHQTGSGVDGALSYDANAAVSTASPSDPPLGPPPAGPQSPQIPLTQGGSPTSPVNGLPTPSSQAPAVAAPSAQPARPQVAADPSTAPEDASGFSRSGVSPFGPGGQPLAPLQLRQRGAFGGSVSPAANRSPWILLPLGLLGLGLFTAGGAAVVRQTRSQGIRATA